MCVYLLNKHMPDSKKYIHVYTKARIKTKKLANLKERRKEMKCYWTRTHIFIH